MIEALRKLNNSLSEREHTIVLQRILVNDLKLLELREYKNAKENQIKQLGNAYTSLVHMQALSVMTLKELEIEQEQDFKTLHTLYDIYETHNLVPYSNIKD